MKIKALFAAGAATLALGACLDGDATGPQCNPIESSVVATNGDTITTSTGLRYLETRVGTGPAVQWCQPVRPQITATLLDTTVVVQPPVPFQFVPGVDVVIPGFAEGVVGIRDGGARRLIIPPALAYGSEPREDAQGRVVVPANSTLIFDVSFPPTAGTQ